LIFGYLLILAAIIVPIAEWEYYIPQYWDGEAQKMIPAPPAGFTFDEQDKISPRAKLNERIIKAGGFKLLPLFVADAIKHKKFLDWKKQVESKEERVTGNKKVFSTEELFYYLESEFLKKYGGSYFYVKFRTELFLNELALIVLMGTFMYILLCVILRRPVKGQGK